MTGTTPLSKKVLGLTMSEDLQKFADWVERDRHEPDKLLCHVQSMRRAGARSQGLEEALRDTRYALQRIRLYGSMAWHDGWDSPAKIANDVLLDTDEAAASFTLELPSKETLDGVEEKIAATISPLYTENGQTVDLVALVAHILHQVKDVQRDVTEKGEPDLSLLICPTCDRPCDDHDDNCAALFGEGER